MYISTGVPEYGQSDGPSNAESDRGYAGDWEHDEADAAGGRNARGHGHARDGADAQEERQEVMNANEAAFIPISICTWEVVRRHNQWSRAIFYILLPSENVLTNNKSEYMDPDEFVNGDIYGPGWQI